MQHALDQLATRFWDTFLEASPMTATLYGDHRFDDRLGPITDAEVEPFIARIRDVAAAAEALDPDSLDSKDRLTRLLLIEEATTALLLVETGLYTASIDPLIGVHVGLQQAAAQTTTQTPEQAEMLLERYRSIPDYLARAVEKHRSDAARGVVPAAINMARVLGQLDAYLASPLEADPFLLTRPPEGWSGTQAWRETLTGIIESAIRPAFATYRQGLADHIAPLGRPEDKPGLIWTEGGEETYGKLIRAFTTLEVPPDEIHAIGADQATGSLLDEYAEMGPPALGTADHTEIFQRMRTDPGLRYESAEEMVEDARNAIERAWEAAPEWFRAMPKAPCEVMEIPEALAPSQPPAYYYPPAPDGSRPGTYFLNTYAPETRLLTDSESTAFHEAIPGHHFQLTIASELEALPAFRRHAIGFAHAEGWGLYSERLADEMGLYSSPVSRLGMLSADSWRAGRLVVDTGLHHLGWSRQQAIDFLTEWSAVEPKTIEQEVDRYIGMPGQALSYKMGQREIQRLRAHAEQELGDGFSLRGFHDVMLTEGSVPLPVLAALVEEWIEQSR